MQYQYRYLPPNPPGPVARALAVAAAIIMLVSAAFIGFFVLAVLLGVAAVIAMVFWLRFLFQGRRPGAPKPGSPDHDPSVVEGEFEVIRKEEGRPAGDARRTTNGKGAP